MLGVIMKRIKGERLGHRVGGKRTPEYLAWMSMIQRCENPNLKSWPHYGGRGIRVCDRWRESFSAFLRDMGEKPEPKGDYSLDRYPDTNGNYEPSNCRWATRAEQARNRTNTIGAEIEGDFGCVEDWSVRSGVSNHVIRARIVGGVKGVDILRKPKVHRKYTFRPFQVGDRVGLLTVVQQGEVKNRKPYAIVQCVCGDTRSIDSYELHRADSSTCGGGACKGKWRAILAEEQGRDVWRLSAKCSAAFWVGDTLYRARSLAGGHFKKTRGDKAAVLFQKADCLNQPGQLLWLPKPFEASEDKWLVPFSEGAVVDALALWSSK